MHSLSKRSNYSRDLAVGRARKILSPQLQVGLFFKCPQDHLLIQLLLPSPGYPGSSAFLACRQFPASREIAIKGDFPIGRGGGVPEISEKKISRYGADFAKVLPLGL